MTKIPCVHSAYQNQRDAVASSLRTILGLSGKFCFLGGTNSKGSGCKRQACEPCGTVGNSDPLPHSAGTPTAHVGYQQNRGGNEMPSP